MTSEGVALIRSIYADAVEAVTPRAVIPRQVSMRPGGRLAIGEREYDVASRQVFIVAFGKASTQMAVEMESLLGERLDGAIVVAKDSPSVPAPRARVLLGSHPVPDERSLEAGREVLEFARRIPAGALVLCLISGGGSALMESLRDGVTLDQLRSTTTGLLRAGATIHELNAVRARLSRLKAGGLLAELRQAEVVNLITSDVLGDDLSTIASGPTVPRDASEPAEEVLRRFGVEARLPDVEPVSRLHEPYSLIVASLRLALEAASDSARRHGLNPVVLSSSLAGEARDVARVFASIVADTASGGTSFGARTCILAGGETTVTVRGDGHGGRNTEAALSAALGISGVGGAAIGFLATDGDDAETGVAGAIVTGETVPGRSRGRALAAMADNDSFTYLQSQGAAWGMGPTGTNVNDLMIGVIT